jgi:phage terminase large subunit
VLIPSVREKGSEIIVTTTPDLESDAAYQRFVANPPQTAVLVKINYRDNPRFPSELRTEMEHLRARAPDA